MALPDGFPTEEHGWAIEPHTRNGNPSLLVTKEGRPPLEICYREGMDPYIALDRVMVDATNLDVEAANRDGAKKTALHDVAQTHRDARLRERKNRLLRRAEHEAARMMESEEGSV